MAAPVTNFLSFRVETRFSSYCHFILHHRLLVTSQLLRIETSVGRWSG